MSSSGIWSCVDLALTDVSEELIASIFRVEKSASAVKTSNLTVSINVYVSLNV
jgi:hypothetical protein